MKKIIKVKTWLERDLEYKEKLRKERIRNAIGYVIGIIFLISSLVVLKCCNIPN